RLASRLGSETLLVTPGSLDAVGAPSRALMVESLTALSTEAGRVGVVLTLQCPEAEPTEISSRMAALPEGLVGIDLSPADVIRHGRSPLQFIEHLGSRIAHVFANDAVRNTGAAGAVDVELGRGSADFPELLAALEEFCYRGWATVERRTSAHTLEDVAN